MRSGIILLCVILFSVVLPLSNIQKTHGTQSEGIVFAKTWGGNRTDVAWGVAADSSGNAYVTGYTNSFGNGKNHFFLLKYDANGSLIWQRTWGGKEDDYGYDVAVDSSGDILVTGASDSFGNGKMEAVLLKFDGQGQLLWQRTWGLASEDIYSYTIAVDPIGNAYLAGEIGTLYSENATLFLAKFNSTGGFLWSQTWASGGSSVAHGVAIGSSGLIFVAGSTNAYDTPGYCGGQTENATRCDDALLLTFDSGGHLLRQQAWGTPSTDDEGWGVAVDSSGGIYLAGRTDRVGITDDKMALLRFGSNGTLLWKRIVEGGIAVSVGIDQAGNAYLTGFQGVPIVKFDPNGDLVGSWNWIGPDYLYDDLGSRLVPSPLGGVLIVGEVGPPPYKLESGNATVSTPSAGVSNASGEASPFVASVNQSSGSLAQPSGIETFGGPVDGQDAFLLRFGSPPSPVETAYSLLFKSNSPCGFVTFDWATYKNGQNNEFPVGNYSAEATENQLFVKWNTTGNLTVTNITSNPTTVAVRGPRTLTAVYSHADYGCLIVATVGSIFVPIVGVLLPAVFVTVRRRKRMR